MDDLELEMLGVKDVEDGRIVQARTADRAAEKLARCMIDGTTSILLNTGLTLKRRCGLLILSSGY
jgi:hypothetical protein